MKKTFPILFLLIVAITASGASFLQKNHLITQPTVTAAAGSTTTLIATSNQVQVITGSTTQTYGFPNAQTLNNGDWYEFVNDSTGIVTVKDNNSVTLLSLRSGDNAKLWLTDNSNNGGTWKSRLLTPRAVLSHSDLLNLTADDHLQYHTDARGDARYYTKGQFISTFSGLANEPILTDSTGRISQTLLPASASAGTGNVTGPLVATDSAVALFNGVTGQSIKNSAVTVGSTGNIVTTGSLSLNSFADQGNILYRRANNNAIAPNALASADTVGVMGWRGYGSTAYSTSDRAQVKSLTAGAWTDTDQSTNIAFSTTPVGSATMNEVMRIQSNGSVSIGTTAPLGIFILSSEVATLMTLERVDNSGGSPQLNIRKARGTRAAPLAIQNGDSLFRFSAAGYNGSAFTNATATFRMDSTEDWTTTANGSSAQILTTPNGSPVTSQTLRIKIDQTGFVGIGSSTVPASKLHVQGSYQGQLTAITTDTTLDSTHQFVTVDTTSGSVNVTLPDCTATILGRVYHIKKIAAANTLTLVRTGSDDTFDGATTVSWTEQYQARTLVCASTTLWAFY